MAVDKELLERYKQMKAQGINITLSELKAQIEKEKQTGYSSQTTAATPEYNTKQQTQTTVWTNSYSEPTPPPSPQQQPQSQQYQYQTPIQPTAAQNQIQPQEPYTGNLNYQTPLNNNYSYTSQFGSGNFNQVQTQEIKETYHGNVQQTANPQNAPATKFGLIGYPLGHSLSTFIHDAGFKSLGLDNYTYELLETHPESLVDRIKFLKFNGYAGFNVTIPLKLPVTLFLNSIDDSADLVGAVNTVIINPDKTLKGYNTDLAGFVNALPKNINLNGKSAGVLGTGGAARAAITGLVTLGVKNFKIYTRNIPNSMDLINYLEKKYPQVEFNPYQIEHIRSLEDLDILVNCTPIGMKGRAAGYSPVEEPQLCTLPKHALVYDVIYNPRKTILIKLAQKNGYQTVTGLDMLIYQALEAQKLWTGRTPDFKDMKIAALENIE